ncbi:MAG TPA: GAF domain-containing protein [Kribbellaceae bacterium]
MPDQQTLSHARLLDAVAAVGADLDLRPVLRRIVSAAIDLIDARYGAVGVLAEDGTGLDELVYVGMDQATADAIGKPPTLCGLLGLLMDEPIRLADVTTHPRAVGFPPVHPPMRSLLGVPIRVRDTVFGILYLTDKRSGNEFTADDERVALALATTAGIAVENARLFEQSRYREELLLAASEVTRLLLSGAEDSEVFTRIAQHVRELTHATDAGVMLPADDGTLRVMAGVGETMGSSIGLVLHPEKTLTGQVFRDGIALNLSDTEVTDYQADKPELPTVGAALLAPLSAAGHTRGVLTASRPRGEPSFAGQDLDTLRSFAEQAELACELGERRRDSEALSLFADRDRIARNLHDLVIQRLFATGMALQGAANLIDVDPANARRAIGRAVGDLDATIKEIRTTVFALQQPVDRSLSLRAKILDVVDAATATLGFAPSLQFDGLVDTTVGEPAAEQLLAVLREALSNVARHAHATSVSILVSARDRLVLQISDDGIGMADASERRSGLDNMAARADQLGGELTIGAGQPGTVLRWAAPAASA